MRSIYTCTLLHVCMMHLEMKTSVGLVCYAPMYMKVRDKIIIDGGNYVIIICESTIEKMDLKTEPRLQSYEIGLIRTLIQLVLSYANSSFKLT